MDGSRDGPTKLGPLDFTYVRFNAMPNVDLGLVNLSLGPHRMLWKLEHHRKFVLFPSTPAALNITSYSKEGLICMSRGMYMYFFEIYYAFVLRVENGRYRV